MSKAPPLAADPLRLVPFGPEHLTDAYVGWLNDPTVVRFSEQRHRYHSLESCAAFVARFDSGPNLLWAIETGGRHIGNISATFDLNNRIADIGILIGAEGTRGRGFGRLAWGAVLDHLCAREDLHKLTGGCLEGNVAMVRIMRGCGMVEDGYRKDLYIVEGKPSSLIYFSKLGNWAPTGQ